MARSKKSDLKVKAGEVSGPFLLQYADLMYRSENGNGVRFNDLSKEDQRLWTDRAAGSLVSLNKLNKVLIDKNVAPGAADSREDDGKYLDVLIKIIDTFVRGVKTVKCPRCKGDGDLRAGLFPTRELALRILHGKH